MRTGEVFSFEASPVLNPDPNEPLLNVGDVVTVGDERYRYRVGAVEISHGIHSWRLDPIPPLAGHSGFCAKVTRATLTGKTDARCNCGHDA